MAKLSEQDFIENIVLEGETPDSVGIQPLEYINGKLNGMVPPFSKRGTHPKEFSVLGVSSVQDIEGIVKFAVLDMIPPGEKNLGRKRQHVLVSDVLPRVVVPVVIKSGNTVYAVLCAQNRITIGGKVTIEIYRGSVKEGTGRDRLALSLMERKLPDLGHTANLLEVRDLGYFWNNTGISGTSTPIQALFYITDKAMAEQELKLALKPEYGTEPDPKKGPILHNTEPVLRTLQQIEERLDEVQTLSLESERVEAYLNDLFSTTALSMLLRSINKLGLPY